jgi:hypothetical protein
VSLLPRAVSETVPELLVLEPPPELPFDPDDDAAPLEPEAVDPDDAVEFVEVPFAPLGAM